jgi:hypothetical protein
MSTKRQRTDATHRNLDCRDDANRHPAGQSLFSSLHRLAELRTGEDLAFPPSLVNRRQSAVTRKMEQGFTQQPTHAIGRVGALAEKSGSSGIEVVDPAAATAVMQTTCDTLAVKISGLKVPWRMPSCGWQLSMMPLTPASACRDQPFAVFACYVTRNDRREKGVSRTGWFFSERSARSPCASRCRR